MSKLNSMFHNKLSIVDTTIYDNLTEEQIEEFDTMFNINSCVRFSDGYEAFGVIQCKTLEEFISYASHFDRYSYWSECDEWFREWPS